MKVKFFLIIILVCCTDHVASKEIVGWVEKVHLTQENILVVAKIDSGARHSSLHCDCQSQTNNKGEKWVHLKIRSVNGETLELDKKVVRQAKIKRHDEEMQIRDVIKLNIHLGSVIKEVEVNLIDRSGLNYQLLVGRSFLSGNFLIDTSKKFLISPK